MKTYKITIVAKIVKTYEVSSETKDKAIEEAHELFTTEPGDVEEYYSQDTLEVESVTG